MEQVIHPFELFAEALEAILGADVKVDVAICRGTKDQMWSLEELLIYL